MAALLVDDVSLTFGRIEVLKGVGFDVRSGEVLAVIGPNGAGKSSLLNVASRSYQPHAGSVTLDGVDVLGRRPDQLAGMGIVRSFQNLGLFGNLSTLDNVMLGRHARMKTGFIAGGIRSRRARSEDRECRERAQEILRRLDLEHFVSAKVGELAYGVQKRVEIARCLMSEPRVLLLDEPVAGMSVSERASIADLIADLRTSEGLAIVLVEHDMSFVMSLADRVLALNFGSRIAYGAPAAVQADQAVIDAYLGSAHKEETHA